MCWSDYAGGTAQPFWRYTLRLKKGVPIIPASRVSPITVRAGRAGRAGRRRRFCASMNTRYCIREEHRLSAIGNRLADTVAEAVHHFVKA